ncbi:hypothetical protein DPMN_088993 [Dreissena polymorpha]|uniref:Uncharacterized protein n=1 Tax=Dreissena polymorpha TaxID=45954 RepID=A0A9D4QWX3_DREPO|nr:hypothetical protein DPMN_088993 [Dreissena polymorpha]
MVNVQYYCFLTNIITKTKTYESETTFFNFVNLPKREKIPLKASAVTSSSSCVTTIIGCGNELGTQLPPFFVFRGKRLNADLLQWSTQGSSGCMSDSGWSNSAVFLHYMDTHFRRYVQRVDKSQPILVAGWSYIVKATLMFQCWIGKRRIT